MKLSIIIPIYNVEDYIDKCLQSLYDQDLPIEHYEIIAVNDGTPDSSMKIVEHYANRFNNIKIVNQKNSGVSIARNNGISNATGDYITFVDPDDWITRNSLGVIYSFLLKNNDTDILILQSHLNDSEQFGWNKREFESQSHSGIDLFYSGYTRGSVCGCFFKQTFLQLNNVAFPLNVRNAEDTIFFRLCQCYSKNIKFLRTAFYNVFARPGSASRTFSKAQTLNELLGLTYVQNILNQDILDSQQKELIEALKYGLISNMIYRAIPVQDMTLSFLLKECNIKQFLPIKTSKNIKQRTQILILNSSVSLFYFLMRLKYNKQCSHKH